MQVARTSPLHRLALWAIESELSRRPLEWSDGKELGPDRTALEKFVEELLLSIMASGFAVWRTTANGELQVADPDNVEISRKSGRYHTTVRVGPRRGWHLPRCTPPLRPRFEHEAPCAGDARAVRVLQQARPMGVAEPHRAELPTAAASSRD